MTGAFDDGAKNHDPIYRVIQKTKEMCFSPSGMNIRVEREEKHTLDFD